MTQTRLATLDSPNLSRDLSFDYLKDRGGRMVYLGRWAFGLALGEAMLEGVPDFTVEPSASPRQRKDAEKASALVTIQPRKCFDAFTAGRNTILFLAQEERRLTDRGYSQAALADAMAPTIKAAFTAISQATNDLAAVRDRVASTIETLSQEFPDTGESEIQSVMFDAAIVARLEPTSEAEASQIDRGVIPARFSDSRTLQALYRCPSAMHSIPRPVVEGLRKAYLSTAWPNSAAALDMVGQMVEQARHSLCSAMSYLTPYAAIKPEEAFKRIGMNGHWLMQSPSYRAEGAHAA